MICNGFNIYSNINWAAAQLQDRMVSFLNSNNNNNSSIPSSSKCHNSKPSKCHNNNPSNTTLTFSGLS